MRPIDHRNLCEFGLSHDAALKIKDLTSNFTELTPSIAKKVEEITVDENAKLPAGQQVYHYEVAHFIIRNHVMSVLKTNIQLPTDSFNLIEKFIGPYYHQEALNPAYQKYMDPAEAILHFSGRQEKQLRNVRKIMARTVEPFLHPAKSNDFETDMFQNVAAKLVAKGELLFSQDLSGLSSTLGPLVRLKNPKHKHGLFHVLSAEEVEYKMSLAILKRIMAYGAIHQANPQDARLKKMHGKIDGILRYAQTKGIIPSVTSLINYGADLNYPGVDELDFKKLKTWPEFFKQYAASRNESQSRKENHEAWCRAIVESKKHAILEGLLPGVKIRKLGT